MSLKLKFYNRDLNNKPCSFISYFQRLFVQSRVTIEIKTNTNFHLKGLTLGLFFNFFYLGI